ncbi:MAG: hypothetical protein IKW39_04215 [Alphaproteobacteria bacterium]|nr:hypothetical protein [Alphaproteobacteria bacterium]
MAKTKQNTVFIHTTEGDVIERSECAVKTFFNKMYLLGNKLFDANDKVMIEKPLSIKEYPCYLQVNNQNCYYLFNANGKEIARSQKEIEVFFNDWFSFFDKSGIKKLVNSKGEIIVENFVEANFYANGWYTVKFMGEVALYDEDCMCIYSCPYDIVVDQTHNRFIVCYSENRISVFEKNLEPVILNAEAFISIENVYAVKRGNNVEVFLNSGKCNKDKIIWKGTKDEFLSDVCIIDADNNTGIFVESF